VLDRLREMFGIEATDVEGVFDALERYDRANLRAISKAAAVPLLEDPQPLTELAAMSPWTFDSRGGRWCFFCHADEPGPHEPTCLWLRAQGATDG
jgi:hypothetical protein